MNRRTVIKTIGAIGALSAIPDALLSKIPHKPAYHFIGLGGFGTNYLSHFVANGAKGKFTYITCTEREDLANAGVHFIPFKPRGQESIRGYNANHVKADALKTLLQGNDKYVLLVGIGGFRGTHLIEQFMEWIPAEQYLAICTLPFWLEGKSKQVVEVFYKKHAGRSNVKFFDKHAFGKANGQMNLKVAFSKVDEYVYEIFRESQIKTFC